MIRKWMTWAALAGVSAVLSLGTVVPAFADQHDNHNGSARYQRDYQQGAGNHTNWNRRHGRHGNVNSVNRYNSNQWRFHRNSDRHHWNGHSNKGAAWSGHDHTNAHRDRH